MSIKEIVKILVKYDAGILNKDSAKDEVEKLYVNNRISYAKMLLVQTLIETTELSEEQNWRREKLGKGKYLTYK